MHQKTTYPHRYERTRHTGSALLQTDANVKLILQQHTEVLFNVPVPQDWGKDCWVDIPGETQHKKNNSGQAHLQRSTTSPSPRRRPAATLKPDRDRNRLPQERDTEDCLARFTRHASCSAPLLALLPLEGDVLRERPAPLRLDAQAAGLVMGV